MVKFPPAAAQSSEVEAEASPRPLCRILRQPSCFAAILAMASSYRNWADQSDIPSGQRLHSYGKYKWAIFKSYVTNYQKISDESFGSSLVLWCWWLQWRSLKYESRIVLSLMIIDVTIAHKRYCYSYCYCCYSYILFLHISAMISIVMVAIYI